MASLKSGIDKFSGDSKTLVEDYLKLFSIKQSEKLALLLGILFSFFMLSLLLLIVILFSSFALAAWLNSVLSGSYTGFLLMGGLYVLLTILLLLRIILSKTPLIQLPNKSLKCSTILQVVQKLCLVFNHSRHSLLKYFRFVSFWSITLGQ